MLAKYFLFKTPRNHVATEEWISDRPAGPPGVTDETQNVVARPLAPNRKRALTVHAEETASGQEESLFFRLPPEVRILIYEYAVGDSDRYVHIVSMRGRMGCKSCRKPATKTLNRMLVSTCKCLKSGVTDAILGANEFPHIVSYRKTGLGFLSFMRSCKKVYAEMIPLVYTQRPFYACGFDNLLMFQVTILPQRWSEIRRLTLDGRTCNFWLFNTYPVSRVTQYHRRHINRKNKSPLEQRFLRVLSRESVETSNLAGSVKYFREIAWVTTCMSISRMQSLRTLQIGLSSALFRDLNMWEIDEEFVWRPLLEVQLPKLECYEVAVDWQPNFNFNKHKKSFKCIARYDRYGSKRTTYSF